MLIIVLKIYGLMIPAFLSSLTLDLMLVSSLHSVFFLPSSMPYTFLLKGGHNVVCKGIAVSTSLVIWW